MRNQLSSLFFIIKHPFNMLTLSLLILWYHTYLRSAVFQAVRSVFADSKHAVFVYGLFWVTTLSFISLDPSRITFAHLSALCSEEHQAFWVLSAPDSASWLDRQSTWHFTMAIYGRFLVVISRPVSISGQLTAAVGRGSRLNFPIARRSPRKKLRGERKSE